MSDLKCFVFVLKCESRRYAQARGIIGHCEERHHFGELRVEAMRCVMYHLAPYIYLVFV